MMKVPFNKPVWLPEIGASLQAAAESGCLAGCGPLTRRAERALAAEGLDRALIVTSGTHALEISALLAGISPGDEVILPSYTFVSTANAFVLRGAVLRFADNDAHGNITLAEVERLTTARTRAVVAVHYAGSSADMDPLVAYCRERRLTLIEDAAQALGATYKGRPLGTFGASSAFSFHETKNVTSGEGGAVWLSTEEARERAEILREKGTNRSKFILGLVDKYTWVDLGSSYVLSELNVAYLLPQLERLGAINARRATLWAHYARELREPAETAGVGILGVPAYNGPNAHMFALVMPTADARSRYIAHMRDNGVTTPFHYLPLHKSPFGESFAARHGLQTEDLPGCERLASCLVRLPLFYNLREDEQAYVIEQTRDFLGSSKNWP